VNPDAVHDLRVFIANDLNDAHRAGAKSLDDRIRTARLPLRPRDRG
jgi:hypothetical protein